MLLKSSPVAFKQIYLSATDQFGEYKEIKIDGNASIETDSQGTISLASDDDKPSIYQYLKVDEINGKSILNIKASSKILQPILDITKVKDSSSVVLNDKTIVSIGAIEGESTVTANDKTSLYVTKLGQKANIKAYNNAKSDIKHCYGTYTGVDETQNKIDTLYGGATVYINQCNDDSNEIASSKIRVVAAKTEKPFTLQLDNSAIVHFLEKVTGKFNINMSGNSLLNAMKGINASSNATHKSYNPSTITINDKSKLISLEKIDGNIDIDISCKQQSPNKLDNINLLCNDTGKDVRITQEGYSKTMIGNLEGDLKLIDNSFTNMEVLTGNLDMGTKSKIGNSLFKSNKTSADVKKLAEGSKVTLSDKAILRYENKDDTAEIIQKGILNRGFYYQVESLND